MKIIIVLLEIKLSLHIVLNCHQLKHTISKVLLSLSSGRWHQKTNNHQQPKMIPQILTNIRKKSMIMKKVRGRQHGHRNDSYHWISDN